MTSIEEVKFVAQATRAAEFLGMWFLRYLKREKEPVAVAAFLAGTVQYLKICRDNAKSEPERSWFQKRIYRWSAVHRWMVELVSLEVGGEAVELLTRKAISEIRRTSTTEIPLLADSEDFYASMGA